MTTRFWISGVLIGLGLGLLLAAIWLPSTVIAQGTPTPTPTPIVIATTLTTSPWYDGMVIRIDGFFDGILDWFEQAESAIAELNEATIAMVDLLIDGEMQIGEESFTIVELADQIVEPVENVFLFRCYLSTDLVDWALIFLAWMVLVMLIKFAISAIPYIIQIVDFIWGKLVDLWQSIPFI